MTASTRTAGARLQGLRVLIVEDETLLALDYEAILREEGCTVLGPAPREDKAMALVQHELPDVVILDLNLDGRRPTDLAALLVENSVPFVIVSGFGDRATEENVFHGAPRLSKPVRTEQLVSSLAELTQK